MTPESNGRISGPVWLPLSDVPPEPVLWLWPNRLPVGKLSLFAGDPSLGKSFVTLDLAARVSAGYSWPDRPDEPNEPGKVVLLSAEDDLADTIRPRLDAAGADVSRVFALQAIRHVDPATNSTKDVPFSIANDLPLLEVVLDENPGVRLLIVDPLSAYMGKESNEHRTTDVRVILAPFAELAARRRIAVLGILHLNKDNGMPAKYRVSGSMAFFAAARAVWMFAPDKKDPDRRLMVVGKNNLTRETDGLAYRIVPSHINPEIGMVAWEADAVEMTADEALSSDDRHAERDEAADWLREILADGPVEQREVERAARAAGIAPRTLRRGKKAAGVASAKTGWGKLAKWFWSLPGHSGPPPEVAPLGALERSGHLSVPQNSETEHTKAPKVYEGGQLRGWPPSGPPSNGDDYSALADYEARLRGE